MINLTGFFYAGLQILYLIWFGAYFYFIIREDFLFLLKAANVVTKKLFHNGAILITKSHLFSYQYNLRQKYICPSTSSYAYGLKFNFQKKYAPL